jgi:hypothetical protein
MTTAAKTAFGSKLYRGSSGTPRTGGQLIEEVTNLTLPDQVDPQFDATSHDSSADEFVNVGCLNNGNISVEMNYKAATGQELMRGTDLGGAATGYYVNLAGGSGQAQLYFSAAVKSFKLGAELKGAIKATAVLTITGPVTWTTQS